MNDYQRAWLKTQNLNDDDTIVDCDPDARTVTYADGRVRQRTEIYTRVMGYHRPTDQWNAGKQQEHRDRAQFREDTTSPTP